MSEQEIINLALLYWREAAAVFGACVVTCGVANWTLTRPVLMAHMRSCEYAWPALTDVASEVYARNALEFDGEYQWPNLSAKNA